MMFKGYSVIRSSTIDESADIILAMANKITRDLKKGKVLYYSAEYHQDTGAENPDSIAGVSVSTGGYTSVGISKVKSDNITPENIATFILSQIPGINFITAESIIKQFGGSFREFYLGITKDSSIIDGLRNETGRKINKNAIENIKKYLL